MADQKNSTYGTETKCNENNNKSAADDEVVDTTAEFLKIFQGKTEFDSWEEFNTLFEEFQRETGSAFKPKSATSVEYANERRVRDKIADRFVYQTVKMVCHHYGTPVRRDTSTSNIKKYVGLGCEAMVHLRYKGKTLNIFSCNLEHRNHKLFSGTDVIRNVRSFSFTDEVDLLVAKVVLKHKPFSVLNSEKEWVSIVEDLQRQDPLMKTVTVRVVKKRIRFLIDRYMAYSNGKPAYPGDEMGELLYELAKAKQDGTDNVSKPLTKKRGRGRPRKIEKEDTDEDEDMEDSNVDFDDPSAYNPGVDSDLPDRTRRSVAMASTFGKDVLAFLNYMEHKDEQDRKIRQRDIDLRREELALHKKEFELQREKFEFDHVERQTHLDLLKAQLEIFADPKYLPVILENKIDSDTISEYTIVLNHDQQFE